MRIRKTLSVLALLAIFSVGATVACAETDYRESPSSLSDTRDSQTDVPELYYLELKRVDLPGNLLSAYTKEIDGIQWIDPRVYAEVYRNGEAIWRSAGAVASKGEISILFGNGEAFATFFKEGDSLDVKIFVATKGALDSLAKNATAGAGGGAVVGAVIGGVVCGVLTGGFGAAGGAAIGAAVGGGVGGAAGALAPVAGAVEISEFHYDSPNQFFGTKAEKAKVHPNSLGVGESVTSVTFTGTKASGAMKSAGTLVPQQTYAVQLREIYIAPDTPKAKAGAKYYAIIKNGEDKQRVELGALPLGTRVALPENVISLRNRGGDTSVKIYRDVNWGKDKKIFSAKQHGGNGTSWLFMGKVSRGNSWIEFGTMDTVGGN